MASNSSTTTTVSFPEASRSSLKVFLNLSKSLLTAMNPSCPASYFRGSLGKHFPREAGGVHLEPKYRSQAPTWSILGSLLAEMWVSWSSMNVMGW